MLYDSWEQFESANTVIQQLKSNLSGLRKMKLMSFRAIPLISFLTIVNSEVSAEKLYHVKQGLRLFQIDSITLRCSQ